MRSSRVSSHRRATPAFVLTALLQLLCTTAGIPYYAARRRLKARLDSTGHIGVARHDSAGFPSVRRLTSSRNLLQTAQVPLCVIDGGFCQLNAAYTTILGPPLTDTQKCVGLRSLCYSRRSLPMSLKVETPVRHVQSYAPDNAMLPSAYPKRVGSCLTYKQPLPNR